ncbi:MAG: hypothetical protein NMNS01_27570 [Nitrosomonas sp.]|nr:MAG: hypothetical protein NMNS01_27570 [Nitrosomonas sp.]
MDSSDALSSWHQKCHVIPLGIDPYNQQQTSSGDMKTANRLWNGAEARVLCIARLSYYKGLPDLLNAARYLRNTRIVIVGTGEQKNELHRLAEDEDITEKIAFVDECEEPLKAVLLDTCTCLCLPSIERTEAFGMALLEAMAHAKPTVICDIPGSGTGWVVQDGETGYIVPMQRPRELAHAIDKLTSDPSKARAMGQAGRQRLESEFSIHGVATRINEIYNRISQDAQEEL